ncbi:hypothetical protein MTR67_035673 [Solanum verrucosum]|uniref:Reverse transcriptase zinc-binding domain-containing protein n=1 Tax=Solanum verrucosum TaxID=315347 RepID=A0AAF0ZLP9_SOLVR|nr:hypothetical protein MTR67_035673 [Solanum verrucosum]
MPTTYLGMPLGSNHKALDIWDGILEKTERKLTRWKAQYLSLGGRLILINSDLDSLPTYVMSLFPIPAKVVEKLDRLRRNLLWHGNKEGKEQGWNISFRIMLNDWEIERVAALLGTLGGIFIIPTATDRVLWKLSRDGVFSVKSAYNCGLHEMTRGTQYPWRYFWKSALPTKVKGFTWLVIRTV